MSVSLGKSKKKSSSNQTTNPWEPTIPGLEGLVGQINNVASTNVGPTGDQQAAYDQLFQNLGQGNPFTDEIHSLSADLFGSQSNSADLDGAVADLKRRLSPTADGANLDIEENPYLQQMIQANSDTIFNRLGAQFAGAGRDWTGNTAGQKALGKGITEGALPTMFNQHNLERQNQMNASNQLFQGETTAAQMGQGLDQQNLALRMQAIPAAQAYMDALNYGPNQIINLEEQLKDMSGEDLATYVTLLGSIAGLGGQQQGTSKASGSSFGLGMNILSDERMKEGPDGGEPEEIGRLADGTPIYRYRYKGQGGEGPVQIGVMAQEVEGREPGAVTEQGGVKYVNYEEATDEAARKAKRRKKG
jgi:hypothetical protein